MSDVEMYAKNQEAFDRKIGKDIRGFLHTEEYTTWMSHRTNRKRKREMTGKCFEGRGIGTGDYRNLGSVRKKRKLVHSFN